MAVSEQLSGRGRRGGRREKNPETVNVALQALGRHWKRPNESLYLYGISKGRQERGLGGESQLSVMMQKNNSAWQSEQGAPRELCGQVLPPIQSPSLSRLPLS